MKTMKAAVVRTFGEPLVIEEMPIPEIQPYEVLVKVMASGVCHTDLHAANGDWPLPIFETILNRITVRGSIVGTRKDLQEAIDFAVDGKVKSVVKTAKLEDINSIFDQMKKSEINGRVVLEIG